MEYFDAAAVRRHLTMNDCIELMADTQVSISGGEITLPLRHAIPLSSKRNALLIMPGEVSAVFGAKLLSLYPDNSAQGRPAIQGSVLLFDSETGAAIAMVEAASLTAIRTAAASASATRVLANPEARSLAILGCGVQAQTHLAAMLAVRPIEEVRIWGRSAKKTAAFVAEQAATTRATVLACTTAEQAVRDADIVCTVTAARQPVLEGAWLAQGVHLNLVGAHSATTREVDGQSLRGARIFTEITEFALAEAGDILLALAEGAIDSANIIGEIGQVIDGEILGRTAACDVTVYKNLGNTAQDLASAHHVYRNAGNG